MWLTVTGEIFTMLVQLGDTPLLSQHDPGHVSCLILLLSPQTSTLSSDTVSPEFSLPPSE